MSIAFSAKISMLRKEKQITQKQAAADLQISQALLSHYEKGIRECSLDFVQKTARYYGVSADYLLGLTELRHGAEDIFRTEDQPEDGELSPRTLLRALNGLWAAADAGGEEDRQYFLDHFSLSVKRFADALTDADPGTDRLYAACEDVLAAARRNKKDAPGFSPEDAPLALRTALGHARRAAAETLTKLRP